MVCLCSIKTEILALELASYFGYLFHTLILVLSKLKPISLAALALPSKMNVVLIEGCVNQ